jgi:hypothetical protein
MSTLLIDNPSNLPLLPLDDFHWFQGDLKYEISPEDLEKLKQSILEHHIFVAKAVFLEDGKFYTTDGHQTLTALKSLQADGYTRCEVVTYEQKNGCMVEYRRKPYNKIMIPYQLIVPQGDTIQKRRRNALRKLLQINSRYADVNSKTTVFEEVEIPSVDVEALLKEIRIPELQIDMREFLGVTEDEENHEEMASDAVIGSSGQYPLSVVLNYEDYQRWQQLKDRLRVKTDTQAVLRLLAQEER